MVEQNQNLLKKNYKQCLVQLDISCQVTFLKGPKNKDNSWQTNDEPKEKDMIWYNMVVFKMEICMIIF